MAACISARREIGAKFGHLLLTEGQLGMAGGALRASRRRGKERKGETDFQTHIWLNDAKRRSFLHWKMVKLGIPSKEWLLLLLPCLVVGHAQTSPKERHLQSDKQALYEAAKEFE